MPTQANVCYHHGLENRSGDIVFIITGGGSGIGRALAQALVARGKSVLIVGRREALLQAAAAKTKGIAYLCADVATDKGLQDICDAVKNKGPISALVNNAGILEPIAPLASMTQDAWHHAFNTNVHAALFLPQKLQDQLQHGRVLNIGSGAATIPIKGWAAYCTTKAALAMLTRCWQMESSTIAFASVKPGIVDTHMQDLARNGKHMDADSVQFYQRLKTHHRLISVQTVAAFLTWLLLDTDSKDFVAEEWDIYDTHHHAAWLSPPDHVLHWDF